MKWKKNISIARSGTKVQFKCDKCGKDASDKPSSYSRKKRHFCSSKCYADFRRENLPIEEHNRYGTGHTPEERAKRRKARSVLNHYLRDKKVIRPKCIVCGGKAEAHHDDYDKPLEVQWLCFKHHRQYHEHPDLINPSIPTT